MGTGAGAQQAVKTTCPYCGVGCGVLATRRQTGEVGISGDPDHPANFGRLCSKGAALGETLSLEDRLLYPIAYGRRAGWDEALETVAQSFVQTIAEHGPDSVAFYVSGQILTEDYYVANKLMKGFIGSANIDTNSRLCMASSVAGHRRAFGSDTVPGIYEDLECADLVVLTGSNLAWCHPVLFQRLMAARETRGTQIVVIDPRGTATSEAADLHLPLRPGSDVALFNGLLGAIARSRALNRGYIAGHTSGFEKALEAANQITLQQVSDITGLSEDLLQRFYDLFIAHERTVTVYSQGVNQSSSGTDKVNAIINCHLASGRIGRPGMGPFSVTGQPNAMGGREVGGLSNMLAAHMDLGNETHRQIVSEFWNAPNVASGQGLKAVDMFRAVADGRIRAIWIMSTNPVVSMPEADKVKAALAACPFVVVSDVTASTDTARLAHVLLPALAWGEKDGTVTNSERRVSRQRAFLDPPGEARADWRHMADVAIRMGFAEAFAWETPAQVYAEHAALSGHANGGTRDFDISAHAQISMDEYENLVPYLWPHPANKELPGGRMFADGSFFTPDRKASFVAVSPRTPASQCDTEFPLVLNTGRIRDQWHTMTRTAKSARLLSHIAEPFLEIHPDDAAALNLPTAGLAQVRSRHGEAVLRVLLSEKQQRGTAFAPMHWTVEFASQGRVDALMEANTDPTSGQPELKFTPVAVTVFNASWFSFAVTVSKPLSLPDPYWALARAPAGWRLECAGQSNETEWPIRARSLLLPDGEGEVLAYSDAATQRYRFAAFQGDRLTGLFFISPEPVEVSRTWAVSLLGTTILEPAARLRLLAGRAGADMPDKGAIICSCFEVGSRQIAGACAAGASSVDAVGSLLKAGTNCGSCRSEIARIVAASAVRKAG